MKQTPPPKKQSPIAWIQRRWSFLAIFFITAGLILIIGGKLESFLSKPQPTSTQSTIPPTIKPTPRTNQPKPQTPPPTPIAFPAPSPAPTIATTTPPNPSSINPPKLSTNGYFGHLSYAEASPDRLVNIGKFVRENYEHDVIVDAEAAQAFQRLVSAAQSQGVQLMAISGFRSIAEQETLFNKQIEKQGSAEAAAQLSAPPGHSEHHTGYAIDITDASRTDVDLKVAFETTSAYQWLVTNAHQYGFEQSFPRNNRQGVSYEPWHWRFVGTPRANQIFQAAR